MSPSRRGAERRGGIRAGGSGGIAAPGPGAAACLRDNQTTSKLSPPPPRVPAGATTPTQRARGERHPRPPISVRRSPPSRLPPPGGGWEAASHPSRPLATGSANPPARGRPRLAPLGQSRLELFRNGPAVQPIGRPAPGATGPVSANGGRGGGCQEEASDRASWREGGGSGAAGGGAGRCRAAAAGVGRRTGLGRAVGGVCGPRSDPPAPPC